MSRIAGIFGKRAGTEAGDGAVPERDAAAATDGATAVLPDVAAADEVESLSVESFRDRARLRRRLRYLRRVRELAFRDLGGLMFELHRFGRERDDLVAAKLGTLAAIDHELRSLEQALDAPEPLTVLREAGIAACPRCGALHGSDANFCPHCGLPVGRNATLPVVPGGQPVAPAALTSGPAPLSTAPAGPPPPPPPSENAETPATAAGAER